METIRQSCPVQWWCTELDTLIYWTQTQTGVMNQQSFEFNFIHSMSFQRRVFPAGITKLTTTMKKYRKIQNIEGKANDISVNSAVYHSQPTYSDSVFWRCRLTLGDFTFWISLSLSLSLSPKLSQKWSRVFRSDLVWLSKRLSESLSPKFGLSPKLIWTIQTQSKWTYIQVIG